MLLLLFYFFKQQNYIYTVYISTVYHILVNTDLVFRFQSSYLQTLKDQAFYGEYKSHLAQLLSKLDNKDLLFHAG